jgi:hypothetical protein
MQLVNESNADQRLKEIAVEEAARDQESKNHNFLQFHRESFKPFRGLMVRSNVSARVLLCLAQEMSFSNDIGYSVEALMQDADASRSSVFEALRLLEREKWIRKVSSTAGTHYRVNSRVFWSSKQSYRTGSFSDALAVPAKDMPVKSQRLTQKTVVARVDVKRAKVKL